MNRRRFTALLAGLFTIPRAALAASEDKTRAGKIEKLVL